MVLASRVSRRIPMTDPATSMLPGMGRDGSIGFPGHFVLGFRSCLMRSSAFFRPPRVLIERGVYAKLERTP
jgi:hypothetical protein